MSWLCEVPRHCLPSPLWKLWQLCECKWYLGTFFFLEKMEYFDLFCINEVYILDSCYPHTILPRILLGLTKFKLFFLSIFVCKFCRMIVVSSLFQLVCICQVDLLRIVYLISSACWNVCFGVHATGSLLLFG